MMGDVRKRIVYLVSGVRNGVCVLPLAPGSRQNGSGASDDCLRHPPARSLPVDRSTTETAQPIEANPRDSKPEWLAEFEKDRPLYVLLGAMILLGVYLRLVGMDGPTALKWDEHHYVVTARNYLNHTYLYNDHPPLSKLVIMAFMQVLGDNPIAWRLPSLLAGFVNMGLIWTLTYRVFSSYRAAWLATAFVAVDGFFIVYSRTALLDGIIVALSLASVLALLSGKTFWSAIGAGIFAGSALSFKLTGLVFVGISAAICLASPRLRRHTPLLLLTIVAVYFAQYSYSLMRVGRPADLAAVIAENKRMFSSNLSYTYVHPYSSKWYTWFLPTKPLFIRHDSDVDGSVIALLTLGNPLLWWGAILAVVEAARLVLEGGLGRLWSAVVGQTNSPALSSRSEYPEQGADDEADGEGTEGEDRAAPLAVPPSRPPRAPELSSPRETAGTFWLLACYAGPIAFWIPSLRDAYIYHYLPAYAFALPLLAGGLAKVYGKMPLKVLAGLGAVLLVSVAYAPFWAELPITQAALSARLPVGWR